MRTNIVLDDALVAEAFRYSEMTTKKDLIDDVLREYVRLRKRRRLLDLEGKIQLAEGYDHKELRARR